MAKFTVEGFDIVLAQLEARGNNVNGAVNHALNAAAKIVKEEMQNTMKQLDIKDKGDLIKSIKSGGVQKGKDGVKYVEVGPHGKDRKGVSNVLKATVAEYGKKGQPARAWKSAAEEKAFPKAHERMAEIFNEEMEKK